MWKPILFIPLAAIGLSIMTVMANSRPELAKLHGISFGKEQLLIQVKSNGCTKAEDFEIDTTLRDGQAVLQVIRIRADRCRAMPRVIEVELPLPEQVEGGYILLNHFVR